MSPITIEAIHKDASARDIGDLADLLLDALASNAGVSFLELTREDAEAWWRSLLASSADRAVILAARDGSGIVGTVQAQPSWAPNQPHRADVAKLIVHRRARRRGIARALMTALEQACAANGLTLLLLDTRKDDLAEQLYVSMGWVRVGDVPRFALNPDGTYCTTVFYYKQLQP